MHIILVHQRPTADAVHSAALVRCSSARNHGRKDVGLPSRLASFSEGGPTKERKHPSWWQTQAVDGTNP